MTTQLPFQFFDCDNHYYEAPMRSPATSIRNSRSGRSNGRNSTAGNVSSWAAG